MTAFQYVFPLALTYHPACGLLDEFTMVHMSAETAVTYHLDLTQYNFCSYASGTLLPQLAMFVESTICSCC